MTKQANKISSAQQTFIKTVKNKSGKYRTEHFPCGIVFIILTYAQTFIICLPFISNIFLFSVKMLKFATTQHHTTKKMKLIC